LFTEISAFQARLRDLPEDDAATRLTLVNGGKTDGTETSETAA
jgi:hypothetical protein